MIIQCINFLGLLLQSTTGGVASVSLFSRSVMANSLRPHGLQHAMLLCPSLSLLKLMYIESMIPSNHLTLCRPLFLLPSVFPSIRVFSNESALCIRWPKQWSFSFSISPFNEYSGLISFRVDWLYLLAVQGTLKSLQHFSSKASILRCSAFFIVQLSHPYMTIEKIIALIRWIFVGKVMSLLFNRLPRLVVAFLASSVFHFHSCNSSVVEDNLHEASLFQTFTPSLAPGKVLGVEQVLKKLF